MVVLVEEEILKNNIVEDEAKVMIKAEDHQGQVEIGQIEILVVIENLQGLEENEEKEDK